MELTVQGRKAYAYTAAHQLDPAKKTVAFVHGAGLDHSCWGLQSRYFGYHGWNVLAVDLPGHGRTPGTALGTIAELADWVKSVLDETGIRSACVVGHSMGALVTLELAARHPQVAEKIALFGVAYPMKVSDAFLDAAKRNDHAAYDMETIWGHSALVPLAGNPNPGMWMYGDMLARLERLGPGTLHADLTACNGYAGGLEAAAKVKCPALFVLGGRDVMTPPRAAQDLVKAIPGAQVVTLRQSGHTLMVEAPDATLDALISFL
jgi:pimeloyl-ACP methyl ester carboxylesterase